MNGRKVLGVLATAFAGYISYRMFSTKSTPGPVESVELERLVGTPTDIESDPSIELSPEDGCVRIDGALHVGESKVPVVEDVTYSPHQDRITVLIAQSRSWRGYVDKDCSTANAARYRVNLDVHPFATTVRVIERDANGTRSTSVRRWDDE